MAGNPNVPPPRTAGVVNAPPTPVGAQGANPGGANAPGGGQPQQSVIPQGLDVKDGGRLSRGPNGLQFSTNNVANNHFAIMKELNELNNTASAALLANKDNDAEVANIQLQMQRFTKILGIIEQNMAAALQFGLSIIGIHDSIFQRPAFRPS